MSRFPDNEIHIRVTGEDETGGSNPDPSSQADSARARASSPDSGPSDKEVLEELRRITRLLYETGRQNAIQADLAVLNLRRNSIGRLIGPDGRFVRDPTRGGDSTPGSRSGGRGPEDDREEGGTFFRRLEFAVFRGMGRIFGGSIGGRVFGTFGRGVGTAVGNVTGQAVGRSLLGGGGAGGAGGVGAALGAGGAGAAGAALAVTTIVGLLAATVAGIDALTAATWAWEKSLSQELAQMNGEIASAIALTSAKEVMAQIEQANQLSNELSGFVRAQSEFSIAFRELQTQVIELFAPLVENILGALTFLTEVAAWFVERTNEAKEFFNRIGIDALTLGIAPFLRLGMDFFRRQNRKMTEEENQTMKELEQDFFQFANEFIEEPDRVQKRNFRPRDR